MIRKKRLITRAAPIVAALVVEPATALASTTFTLEYSGADFLNDAEAHGTITFAPDNPPNPSGDGTDEISWLTPGSEVTAFSLTVTGADYGNGTFGLSDFDYFSWNTKGVELDLTQNLIGQFTVDGLGWASEAGAGGFGLGATERSGAPTSLLWYVLATNEDTVGQSDWLKLTSFTPVPLPAAIWLFGTALSGLLAGAVRRKRLEAADC